MIEFEVEFRSRPIGVRFAHADKGETIIVHVVLENQLGYKLGLLPGDILLAIDGKSVFEMKPSAALDLFSNCPTPFKASFRRFEEEDDDEIDSDNNNSQDKESEHTTFMREDMSNLMQALSVNPMGLKKNSINVQEWNTADICDWLLNYGKTLKKEENYEKYCKMFEKQKITGKQLKEFDKNDLLKIGVDENDYLELYSGIQQLYRIFLNAQQTQETTKKTSKEENIDNMDNDNKNDINNEHEDSGYKKPFLPYMYNAPSIKLTEKTKVSVYRARVAAPYKKKAFALYEMEVSDGNHEWLSTKRYAEFHRLYKAMKKIGVHVRGNFPKKGLFYNSTEKEVIEERKVKLTSYINTLLEYHPKARESKELNDFLLPSCTYIVDQ